MNIPTRAFHDRLVHMLDRSAPMKTHKKKSTDDPWINDNVIANVRKRKRLFKRRGRAASTESLAMDFAFLEREKHENQGSQTPDSRSCSRSLSFDLGGTKDLPFLAPVNIFKYLLQLGQYAKNFLQLGQFRSHF